MWSEHVVDDLKAEAAKLLKEAELAEKTLIGDGTTKVTDEVHTVETDAKADVAKVETAVTGEVKAVETKVEADTEAVTTDAKQAAATAVADVAVDAAKVAAKVTPAKGFIVVHGTRYAADGLTIEWKEK